MHMHRDVALICSLETLKVVQGGSSAFYSVHFTFVMAPTHPIIVSPICAAHCLRTYPSVIKFTPESAHIPQFFRVTVVEDGGYDSKALTLEHNVQSIDPLFCGSALRHVPKSLTVVVFQTSGKYVLSAGDATYGELGQDTFEPRLQFGEVSFHHLYSSGRQGASPTRMPSVPRQLCESVHITLFSHLACGSRHAIIVDANGRLFAFGDSEHGQLGLGSNIRTCTKPNVWNGLDTDARLHSKLTEVACGSVHTLALTDDNEILGFGDNDHGQLGFAVRTVDMTSVPKCLPPLRQRVTKLACGLKHSMALLDNATVVSWGYGKSGALGHGSRENVDVPTEIFSLRGRPVYQVACGDMHSAVVLSSGELLTTGWSENGRLGRVKTMVDCCCTFEVVDLKGKLCSFVACGGAHTMCLTDKYDVVAFGANAYGQLGVGDCVDRPFPTEVIFFHKVKIHHLAMGKFHSLAISDDRMLYAWGNGEQGQCGIDSFPQIYTLPHLVTSLLGCQVHQVSAGDAFTLILTSNTPAAVLDLSGRDEHWKMRRKQIIEDDKVYRVAIPPYIFVGSLEASRIGIVRSEELPHSEIKFIIGRLVHQQYQSSSLL
ncbi:hypothetical protein AeRB84_019390 [Aphanomyces euteiches]|nr:hypothetical protein AeRB84_019390 [Aphanomyces euteiches]